MTLVHLDVAVRVRINHLNWYSSNYVLVGFEYPIEDDYSISGVSDTWDHSMALVRLDGVILGSSSDQINVTIAVIVDLSSPSGGEQVCMPMLSPPEVNQQYLSCYIPSW